MTDYTVVWTGASWRDDQAPIVPTIPTRPHRSTARFEAIHRAIGAALRSDWVTLRELREKGGCSADEVYVSLQRLRRHGKLETRRIPKAQRTVEGWRLYRAKQAA